MLIGFYAVLALVTAVGCYAAERVDAPRRRAERDEQTARETKTGTEVA
jgi:hypothetical protein